MVTGTVITLRREADGDEHVIVKLDSDGTSLVTEIVCVGTITQADAVAACAGYTNRIPVPLLGDHISVTGPYVYDTNHGWYEIHPVWTITRLTAMAPSATSTPTFPSTGDPMARCQDGSLSYSQTHSGTCAKHGGVAVWYR